MNKDTVSIPMALYDSSQFTWSSFSRIDCGHWYPSSGQIKQYPEQTITSERHIGYHDYGLDSFTGNFHLSAGGKIASFVYIFQRKDCHSYSPQTKFAYPFFAFGNEESITEGILEMSVGNPNQVG